MLPYDPREHVAGLCSVAEKALHAGDWAKAKSTAVTALAAATGCRDGATDLQAAALYCQGAAAGQLGQRDEGLQLQRVALGLYRELKDPKGISRSLENIGIMVPDASEALRCAEESAAIAHESQLAEQEAVALIRAGTLHGRLDNHLKGLALFDKAQAIILSIADDHRRNYRLNHCLGQLGRNLCGIMTPKWSFTDRVRGMKLLDEAIECSRCIGCVHAEEYNRMYKALALEQEGMTADAVQELVFVETSFFGRWKAMTTDELRRAFSNTWLPTTVSCTLQRLHISNNDPKFALLAAERSRAWAFSAMLSEQHHEAIRQHCLQWEDVSSLAVNERAAILFYSVPRDGCFVVWVIASDGSFKGHCHLDASEAAAGMTDVTSLANLVQIARGDICDSTVHESYGEPEAHTSNTRGHLRQRRRGADEQLTRCFQLFFKPVAELLDEESDLLIVPDRELYMLPFAGLRNPDTGLYLIETYTMRFTPSLAALIALRARRARVTLHGASRTAADRALLVAVEHFPHPVDGEQLDDLAGAVTEAASVKGACEAKGISVEMLLREHATKAAVIEQLESATNRIIHVCTHGTMAQQALVLHSESDPKLALLSAEEVQRLRLSAELGVLSACNTGRGTVTADGVAGLCRCFLAAGLDAVVATLCKVGDNSTCEFMQQFYQVYLAGRRVNVAMQAAMCSMLRCRDVTGHRVYFPADWAPFVCFGAF